MSSPVTTDDVAATGPAATRRVATDDVVRAAGAVLWRPAAGGPGDAAGAEVAVVHRPGHRDWSLPKGKVDPGETRADAAVREIAEETGFDAVLGRHLATVRYAVGGRPKTVDYWAARAVDGAFATNTETDELRWLPPADAAALLSYDSDRDVLTEFAQTPADLRTVLLVRHGRAGRRADWDGPDGERPLDAEGRLQALRLADLLTRHGVTALHAAPRTRCRETFAPLAARRGVDVVDEAALGDEAVQRDPAGARRRLLEIASVGRDLDGHAARVVAVCAQGDGIPRLVRDLARDARERGGAPRSNRELAAPPARKGSVWVLSFADGPDGPVLATADYVRDAGA